VEKDGAIAAVEELRAAAAAPFERAMPRSVHTAPDFAELERDFIFHREWLCVGRAGRCRRPGTT
jgi:choline monooxygenase